MINPKQIHDGRIHQTECYNCCYCGLGFRTRQAWISHESKCNQLFDRGRRNYRPRLKNKEMKEMNL